MLISNRITIHPTVSARIWAVILVGFILSPLQEYSAASSGKVVDFGEKLPDYIKENPHKGWLIKFYTPWCHNCQQIELTYIEVAERIYHAHDHLVVGQVNCDKYDILCRNYDVEGVPTILYLRGEHRSKYNGSREVNSIVSFAERMNGPDVNIIHDCNQIIPEVGRRGLIVLHSDVGHNSSGNTLHQAFDAVAAHMKRDYWFYRLYKSCRKDLAPRHESIFILKRSLRRWIKFETEIDESLESSMKEFVLRESFPVFGPLTNQMMNSSKLLAVAVLDEYGPARKLHLTSKRFYKVFEQIAIDEAQNDDQILFAWSTDLHAIRKIALSHVPTPNVILLKSNLSHNLLLKPGDNEVHKDSSELQEQLPEALSKEKVVRFIQAARRHELEFSGGDSYYHRVARYIYSYTILVKDKYEANPVLTCLMLISMATTIVVLLYKTKNYLSDDDEEEIEPENVRLQTNHRKQD